MIQRILALTAYFLRNLATSLSGAFHLLLAIFFALLFFRDAKPDADYYIIIVTIYGALAGFLLTLTVTTRANRAENASWVVRLPSRIEFLAAVFLTGLLLTLILQLLVAALGLRGGINADLTLARCAEIPPIWVSMDILIIVLALHASDLVTKGWSRVWIFGVLLVLLFGQSGSDTVASWLSGRLNQFSVRLGQDGLENLANPLREASSWLALQGGPSLENVLGLVFWPFRAIVDGVTASFDRIEALAPAFLLLYATILFLLAADFFATKDIHLVE